MARAGGVAGFKEDVGAFVSRSEVEAWIEQRSAQLLKSYQRPRKLTGFQ
jgi:hypothetical protein